MTDHQMTERSRKDRSPLMGDLTPKRSSLSGVVVSLVALSAAIVIAGCGAPAEQALSPVSLSLSGNSDAAHQCQQGGYLALRRLDGTGFKNVGDCVSYAARGGTFGAISTTATVIHNAAHSQVTEVRPGTTVHDLVTVSGGVGNPVPTGNVTIDWFLNGSCTGNPAVTSGPIALVGGAADATGFSFTVNTVGSRAFRAHYAGDATYTPSDGTCEALQVVTFLTSTTTTVIHDASHSPVTQVATGTVVHDKVTVSGSSGNPDPFGNVIIDWFLNGTCAGSPVVTSSPLPLLGGVVDAGAFNFTVNSAGFRAFRAHYLGDANYAFSDGPCEGLQVGGT